MKTLNEKLPNIKPNEGGPFFFFSFFSPQHISNLYAEKYSR